MSCVLAAAFTRPGISQAGVTSTSITVRITTLATSSGSITYELFYRKLVSSGYTGPVVVADPGQSQTVSSLQPFTQYVVFIKARSGNQDLNSNVLLITTLAGKSLRKAETVILGEAW